MLHSMANLFFIDEKSVLLDTVKGRSLVILAAPAWDTVEKQQVAHIHA